MHVRVNFCSRYLIGLIDLCCCGTICIFKSSWFFSSLHCYIKYVLLSKPSAVSVVKCTTHMLALLLTYQFCCAICRRGLQLQSVWAPNINIQSISWAKNSVHQLASKYRICPKLVGQVPPNRHRNVLRAASVAQVGQSLVHCTRHCESGSNLSPLSSHAMPHTQI